MKSAVITSYYTYVAVFVITQQIICRVKKVQRTKLKPILMLHVIMTGSITLVFVGEITMAHWQFDNLLAVRLTGFITVAAGLVVSMWAQVVLGQNWVGGIGVHKSHQLITTGPYRLVRNPLYAGMWISAFGLCLVTLNVFYGLGSLLLALAYSTRIPAEEDMLYRKFKGRYVEYADRTGRLFPRIRRK